MGNSSSQQTWLSSDDFRIEKPLDKSKIEGAMWQMSVQDLIRFIFSQ